MRFTRPHLSCVIGASLLIACSSDAEAPPSNGTNPKVAEDERTAVGVPNNATEYCQKLGFKLDAGACKFPDGSSCEQWAFFRAECGQAHSYCNQHGGTVSTKTENMGTWTAVYAVCDVGGKQCKEANYLGTGKCE